MTRHQFLVYFLSGLSVLWATGCHVDRTPVVAADIQFIEVGHYPLRLAPGFSPNQFLVTCFKSESVDALSLSQLAVSQTFTVQKGPSQLVRDMHNQLIYCLHNQQNAMVLLGGDPLRVKKSIGTGTISLASGTIRPGSNELWVCDGTSAVYVLQLPAVQLKKRVDVGRYPQAIAFSADGTKGYVTLKGENAVAVLDAQEVTKVASIPVGIYPSSILVSGDTACVSNFGSQDISLLDLTKNLEQAKVRVREEPNRMALQKNILWVSCEKSYRLAKIDITKAEMIGTIKLGFYPGDVLAAKEDVLLVTDPKGDRVAIIHTTKK